MDTSKIIKANSLKRKGWSWDSIGVELGTSGHAIRYACDENYANGCRARSRRYAIKNYKRARTYDCAAPGLSASKVITQQPAPVVPRDVLFERERAMQAPRSLTASLCGDPPAHRSALAKRGTP